jgi:putative transcriptional regulator
MPVSNLCFVTMLAAMVAFPAVRKPEVEIRQSNQAKANSGQIEMPLAVLVPTQSRNPKDLGPGKLLVASRELGDPNFAETVILLVHYDATSVVGLMLNRRTDLPVSRVLAQFDAAKDRSDRVYLGGPVETPTVFALLRSTEKLEKAEHVFGGVYWLSTKIALENAISSRPDPDVFHVYLGYAGWTTEQLRNEVRLGGWFIFPADHETVFNANPDSLWREMIKKTELKMTRRPTTVLPQLAASASQ